jgi:hypothetical protein
LLARRLAPVAAAATAVAALLLAAATPATAQTFGRSKVQYDHFDFRILQTPHFGVYFYPAESLATADAARMAERWYDRHSALLRHTFTGNPLIFYADAPDFQQSNVVEGSIGVGTGGVTEGARDRVIMPFTGIYADNDHVLGHELVHVFQYRIAESVAGGTRNMMQIPLWLIEGMAEYLSIGRDDPNTAMWLRDAARRNDLPTIKQLTTDPNYFPYRYGQALWAYIGGRWGDDMVNQLYRAALKEGWERALVSQLGMNADSLSKEWHGAIRQHFATVLSRTAPDAVGQAIVSAKDNGDQNVSPAVSPDGQFVSFFSSRNLFGMDLYIAETATGRVIRQVTDITRNPHFDALSFISSGGSWSPDGRRLAIVTFADGDNEIDVLDVRSGRVEQRIRVGGVTALADPAFSPDGNRIAFSGLKGGISDLYVHDLASKRTTQLTSDREAQIQPAWSPDGRWLAFATDADVATRFDALTFSALRLALLDVNTRQVQLLPRVGRGKAINPQFSQRGDALYFVSDQDGVSDLYRLVIDGGALYRVTSVATGISGITGASPAISVASKTGDVLFSVFDRGGFSIRRIAAANAVGQPFTPAATVAALAGVLPPVAQTGALTGTANGVLDLPPSESRPAWLGAAPKPYRARLTLESVGGASVGASVGSGYGTGLAGGVSFGFSDMLGNHIVNAAVQANGSARDIGGQVLYLNRERRLNWGAFAQHVPLVGTYGSYDYTTVNAGGTTVPATVVTQVFQREYYDDAQGIVQYPLSSTRRLEFGLGAQRISFGLQVDSLLVVGDQVAGQVSRQLPTPPALTFASATAAFVGDYSYFGFTSPIAGGRYRFEAAPYVGTLNYQTLLADYRRYFFKRPFTLAMRGLHFGRYGADADDDRMQPLFVGQPALMRGYDPNTFDLSECTTPAGATAGSTCPELTRLNGTRVAVANVEFRIPLLGPEQLGLIHSTILPVEIAPFIDGGVAWRRGDSPKFRFDQRTTDRVPVFSAGVTTRANLFGYAVVEVFWARPFQRPSRAGVWGFQLAPGW